MELNLRSYNSIIVLNEGVESMERYNTQLAPFDVRMRSRGRENDVKL